MEETHTTHADNFADWIARQLDLHGWTNADLARATGLSPSVTHRWQTGIKPNVDNARALAAAIHVPLLEILVVADVLTADEAQVPPSMSARDLTDAQLMRELKRRLGEQ